MSEFIGTAMEAQIRPATPDEARRAARTPAHALIPGNAGPGFDPRIDVSVGDKEDLRYALAMVGLRVEAA